ncbi:hypothetical protein BDQ12DRAFT_7346 [Crucibulum laeve]|uniref:Uncharacterized protein n=1 Tax=Crucibulum laeve TaxID=68775 RepID=A0A5C3MK25_9AGAR|nr:hypothetical protein BDQ12DRAFT_7346 [Crucibulum laeve]
MSVVSSVFSSRSSWRIHERAPNIMDSIFAIGSGLGLRYVVDSVSHHDFKLTGTLVGLWEGVVLLHFVKKMPSSFDPYVAYGVRLFVDLLVTESFARLVLVIVWTGLGMVLADITPAIWVDVGLNRIWRRFRRDMYTLSRQVPRVAIFPRTRTVRFSPSSAPSVITSASSTITPSVITPTTPIPPTTRVIPPTPIPGNPTIKKRHVPGSFPSDFSETDTDIGSVFGLHVPVYSEASTSNVGTTHHRYSSIPRRRYSDQGSEVSRSDLDEENLSTSDSSSDSTVDPSAFNPSEIPDVEEEEEIAVDKGKKPERDDDRDETPKPRPLALPPTPSDSARAFDLPVDMEEVPPTARMPLIPDAFDGGGFSDWENVTKEEANAETPPAPPPKDDEFTTIRAPSPEPQPIPPPSNSTPLFEDIPVASGSGSQVVENPVGEVADELDDFLGGPLAPTPPTVQPEPSLNDLLGTGTDRPPSYSEPYADAAGSAFTMGGNEKSLLTGEDGEPLTQEPLDTINESDENAKTPVNATNENPAHNNINLDDGEENAWAAVDSTENPTGNPDETTTPPTAANAGQQQSPEAEHQQPEEQQQQQQQQEEPAEEPPVDFAGSSADSVTSSAGDFLESVTARLHQAVVLRGQMLQTEDIIKRLQEEKDASAADWSSAKEAQLAKAERALGKMTRKAEKRYAAVIDASGASTPPKDVDLSAVVAHKVEEKIEEALELHLRPGTKSLQFTVTVGKVKVGRTQKPIVVQTLDNYKLPYSNDPKNMRVYEVNVPEDVYAQWLESNRVSDQDDLY